MSTEKMRHEDVIIVRVGEFLDVHINNKDHHYDRVVQCTGRIMHTMANMAGVPVENTLAHVIRALLLMDAVEPEALLALFAKLQQSDDAEQSDAAAPK